jgi:hypothetical protein
MPADSKVAHRQPFDSQSELSVSRKVKIGIVLLLMLSAYFLLEARPRPANRVSDKVVTSQTDDSQMRQCNDDLGFLQPNHPQQSVSRDSPAAPLTLPGPITSAEPYHAESSFASLLALGVEQHTSPAVSDQRALAPDRSSPMHHETEAPEPVPTIVRLTGQIETLR